MYAEEDRRRRFAVVFDTHRIAVASYCNWRASSFADAEDAVAEVFLVAWRRLEVIPDGAAARAWMYATARRVMANQRRGRRRRTALEGQLAAERRANHFSLDAQSQSEIAVHDALAQLDDHDREVLLLVEWEGLRPRELARVLGCREVTARGRLHRARQRFRQTYESLIDVQNQAATSETFERHNDDRDRRPRSAATREPASSAGFRTDHAPAQSNRR
jgi:RNA polymerase sigma-70 factor (ECF subfamily)